MKHLAIFAATALSTLLVAQAGPAAAQSVYGQVVEQVRYAQDDDGRRHGDFRRDRRDDRRADRRDDRRDERRDERRDDRRSGGWHDSRGPDNRNWSNRTWDNGRRDDERRRAEQRWRHEQQRHHNQGNRHYDNRRDAYREGYRDSRRDQWREHRFSRWTDVTPYWVSQHYGQRPGWSYNSGRWHADRSVFNRAWSNVHRPQVYVSHRYQPWNGYVNYRSPHVAWYHDRPDWVYVNGRQRPYYYDYNRSAYYTRDDNNAEILIGVAVAAVGLALILGAN